MKWAQTLLVILIFSPMGYGSEYLQQVNKQVEAMPATTLKSSLSAAGDSAHHHGNMQFWVGLEMHSEYQNSLYKIKSAIQQS
ncbi:hypothetical protein [Aliiglaciecola aliphaticivorans]